MAPIQTILAIGSLVLLILTTLNFNSSYLYNSNIETENKVMLTAFSLADAMIEEIKARSFDEKTLQFTTANPSMLTSSGTLGPESGETYNSFDDIDDYNGYQKLVSAPHAEDYQIKSVIQYVKSDNPDEVSSIPTFYKRATVYVSSPFLKHNVRLSFIFSLK